jgi:tRNA (guanine37-N1)-methyltransferase
MFVGPLSESILKRAVQANRVSIGVHDIRDFTQDRHHTADDYPFGGGAGLVMKPEPILAAVRSLGKTAESGVPPRIVLLSARGRRFTHAVAAELATQQHVILICGHYEGIDERVGLALAADEVSIGDYVLTGGELAAMVIVDAAARLVPGVLGAPESLDEESISSGLLEYPQYTRPATFDRLDVPGVLLSGDHDAIRRWRRHQSIALTYRHRPDLLARAMLSREDANVLSSLVEPSGGRRSED